MVVCARLPNKFNMGGQNSLMSLVFWFPCWKNTNTSVQTNFWQDICLQRWMKPFYLRERKEKWTIYTLPSVCISPVLFLIHFRHATYKENVVKNQELFQVCDHFFLVSVRPPGSPVPIVKTTAIYGNWVAK